MTRISRYAVSFWHFVTLLSCDPLKYLFGRVELGKCRLNFFAFHLFYSFLDQHRAGFAEARKRLLKRHILVDMPFKIPVHTSRLASITLTHRRSGMRRGYTAKASLSQE
jgi:hypothetical protein